MQADIRKALYETWKRCGNRPTTIVMTRDENYALLQEIASYMIPRLAIPETITELFGCKVVVLDRDQPFHIF